MSGTTPHADGTATGAASYGSEPRDLHELWEGRTRVFLQPLAAPSILGLFGFAGATMMVGAWQAGWYGNATDTPMVLFPFAALFGGVAQFLAGMWSYRARDGLATAMHGMWGAFWIAFGILFLLVDLKAFPAAAVPHFGSANPAFAFWFVVLSLITAIGAIAAAGVSLALVTVLAPLATGAALTAAGFFAPALWADRVGGWLFVAAAAAAVYTAAAMMFEESFGRVILPTGKYRVDENVPGRKVTDPLEYRFGQPGVKVGQ